MAEIPTSSEAIFAQTNLEFAMFANGYSLDEGKWHFHPPQFMAISEEFRPENISFSGPSVNALFFRDRGINPERFLEIMNQPSVLETVTKYRRINPARARKISYFLGGIIRHLDSNIVALIGIRNKVDFAAKMIGLGEQKSGEAITAGISMYIISGGSTSHDVGFAGSVYHMADSIREDPISPRQTSDLGLSQVARLQGFVDRKDGRTPKSFPDISDDLEKFDGFPTVGAEFHLPPEIARDNKTLWKRLAMLNISQYQRGSYIQLSRNDQDVIEIRMNPSVYPVTIANWKHIKLLVPEINSAFFTLTLNRPKPGSDFQSLDKSDVDIYQKIRSLGLLTYASFFDNNPQQGNSGEIDFGEIYLGQTVRVNEGDYEFTGVWGGNRQSHGQLALYMGLGKNFPYLAYYTSMVLDNTEILDSSGLGSLPWVRNINGALETSPEFKSNVFRILDRSIDSDPRLAGAREAGIEIYNALRP